MKMWRGVLLVFLVYLRFIPINSSSHYHVKYEFHSYSHQSGRLYNGKSCEYLEGINTCDPQFDILIQGKAKCQVMSKRIPYVNNVNKIDLVYKSNISTQCDLGDINIKVVVKDRDPVSSNDLIELFFMSIRTKTLNGFKRLGNLKRKYHSGARIQYSIAVNCDKYYYGNTCNEYCHTANSYQCDSAGRKVCTLKCSPNQQCLLVENEHFECICISGWKGEWCNITTLIQSSVTNTAVPPTLTTTKVNHSNQTKTVNPSTNLNTTNLKGSTTISSNIYTRNVTMMNQTTQEEIVSTISYIENQQSTEVINGKNESLSEGRRSLASVGRFLFIPWIIIGILTLLCLILIAMTVIRKRKAQIRKKYYVEPVPSVLFKTTNSGSQLIGYFNHSSMPTSITNMSKNSDSYSKFSCKDNDAYSDLTSISNGGYKSKSGKSVAEISSAYDVPEFQDDHNEYSSIKTNLNDYMEPVIHKSS